jgi:glutamine amidotransferase-like uncharacterized protein
MPAWICSCAIVLIAFATAACGDGGLAARPRALVYRGPAGCDGCSEAVAELLETSRYHFAVTYVGPDDAALTDDLLDHATVYAQPGGGGSVDDAFAYVRRDEARIRAFVRRGGRYLGFCMGGYFAGKNPGFGLLPGDSGEFITSPGASVTTEADTTVQVLWRGVPHTLYFQDGPYFIVGARASEADVAVLATYASNDEVAALVAPFGKGVVGVVGPHPEATPDWYRAAGLTDPEHGHGVELGHDLVEVTMAR